MSDALYRGWRYRVQCLLFGQSYARLAARFRAEHAAIRADRARRGVLLPEDGWVCHNTTWTVPPWCPDHTATPGEPTDA